jgi:hypothetical protein
MTRIAMPSQVHRYTCLAIVLAALFATVAASSASAATGEFSGRLPGKSWTTNGYVGELAGIAAEVNSGPTAICVGPVQHSGGGYTFPYGWDCGTSAVSWSFPALVASPGVDNPNSGEDKFYALYWT